MRLILKIPDDIFEYVENISKSSGKSLSEVVTELLKRTIIDDEHRVFKTNFPTFKVSKRSSMIPGLLAYELF